MTTLHLKVSPLFHFNGFCFSFAALISRSEKEVNNARSQSWLLVSETGHLAKRECNYCNEEHFNHFEKLIR